MKLERSNFNKILSKGRKLTLFGASEIANKTIRKLDKTNILSVVDNSKNLQGTIFNGFEIKSPSSISSDSFVLICSTAITSISKQLIDLGFEIEKDFTVSPSLNDLLIIEELENINTSFYFTSGSFPSTNTNHGGGLYKVFFNHEDIEIKKIYSGPCYEMIRHEDKILFIDTDKGIQSFDPKKNKVITLVETPKDSRAHGISFNEHTKNYYVSCSTMDAIIEYDNNFKEVKRFNLSKKIDFYSTSMHHCNDNYTIGNSLFVSMFSSSGNWKRGVFDGCVAEFDIETGQRLNNIVENLYMPHNITSLNGSLHVLDSLPGHLRADNFEINGTFPGFTRGLDYYKGFYFIGQSKNRNFSKVIGLSNNISVDCGVTIFEPISKVSRTLKFSNQIGEIHSILINNF